MNHLTASIAETPFGGVKDSGYGREGAAKGWPATRSPRTSPTRWAPPDTGGTGLRPCRGAEAARRRSGEAPGEAEVRARPPRPGKCACRRSRASTADLMPRARVSGSYRGSEGTPPAIRRSGRGRGSRPASEGRQTRMPAAGRMQVGPLSPPAQLHRGRVQGQRDARPAVPAPTISASGSRSLAPTPAEHRPGDPPPLGFRQADIRHQQRGDRHGRHRLGLAA